MSRAGKTSAAAFLNKLWKLVNDPVTDDLIKWAVDGKSFIITDQNRFSQELVPKYFKHNNMASFIRQLNLYGFRKVVSIESGSLMVDKGEMEFSHPKFIQGQEILIAYIKRKPQGTRAIAPAEGIANINDVLSEVQSLKSNQDAMREKMSEMSKENQTLWREYSTIRQKFTKQQQVITKLVRFLISMVKNPSQRFGKLKFNHLALEGGEHSMANAAHNMSLQYEPSNLLSITGPVIHEVTDSDEFNPVISLSEIFQDSSNINSHISRPRTHVNSYSQNTRLSDPVCKLESLESIVLADELTESDSRVSDPVPVTHILSESNNDEDGFDSVQLVTDNKADVHQRSNRVVTVQSPNGTFLPHDSPPLSPELLQTVDPSLVSPNIVVNLGNKVQTNLNNIIHSSDTPRTAQGKNVNRRVDELFSQSPLSALTTKPKQEKFLPEESTNSFSLDNKLDYFLWNNSDSVAPQSPSPSSIQNTPGKNWSKIGKMEKSAQTAKSFEDLEDASTGEDVRLGNKNLHSGWTDEDGRTGATSYDMVLPEKMYEKDDFLNHVDEVQVSLDYLKDMFTAGNLNLSVDKGMLLSLFGEENSLLNADSDLGFPGSSEVLGNEVSLYNPSLYDLTSGDTSDVLNFSSLVSEEEEEDVSPVKKMRFGSGKSEEEEITTPHPHQLPFNFKRS